MPHSARKLLLDVSLACQEIMEFTDGKFCEAFHEDQSRKHSELAIEREFEIIGEFLFRLAKVEPEKMADESLNIERSSISEIFWHRAMIV